MTDEEKEALEILKSFEPDDLVECSIYLQALEKITNLIEKQSKEIEELKRVDKSNSQVIANMSTRHFHDREKIRKYEELQDKIKAKMKEKEWSLENYDCNESDYKQSQAIGAWSVLQSLLEEKE